MDSLEKSLLRDMTRILMRLVPGAASLQDASDYVLDRILSRRENDAIRAVAEDVFRNLYDSTKLDRENQGAARAAAYNILASIQKAEISAETLVRHCLDPAALYGYLVTFPPEDARFASDLRLQLWDQGLRGFCQSLCARSLDIPGIQILIYRQILANQAELLDLLKKQVQKTGAST